MNAPALIGLLATFPRVLRPRVEGLSADDARWRPTEGDWSVVEIVAHIADEEVLDFRARLRSTLEDPAREWTPIDPEGRAVEAGYRDMDLEEALGRFERERAASLEWLRDLGEVDWSQAYVHPKFGPIRAGDLLLSWTTHDVLHERQVAKRLYQLAVRDGGGFDASYAGSPPA